MKTKLSRVVLVLVVGLSGLALAASAAGTTASGGKVRVVLGPVQALTLAGTRVVYGVGANATSRNGKPFQQRTEVLVWDLQTGKTTKMSGTGTASAGTVAWGGVIQLAIAGSRVAWLTRAGGNSEADDDLFTSSLLSPKERHVAGEVRYGDACGAGASGPPACAGHWTVERGGGRPQRPQPRRAYQGGKLQLFNTQTGNRWKTFPVHGTRPGNLDVQGHIAIYTTGSSVHAVNLLSRKDRVIGALPGGVELARIGTAGVAYTSSRFYPKGTLVVLPFARVAAAVS